MKAIVQDRYGSPDVLRAARRRRADARPRTRCWCGCTRPRVNARDWHIMRGDPYLARLARRDVRADAAASGSIRGRDFAGRVEAVGRGRDPAASPATRCTATSATRTARSPSTCALPADLLEPKPANLTFEQAAAMPLAGNTALLGLRDVARRTARAAGPDQRRVRRRGHVRRPDRQGVRGGRDRGVQHPQRRPGPVARRRPRRRLHRARTSPAARRALRRRVRPRRQPLAGATCRRVLTPDGTLVLSGGGVSEGGSLVGPMGLIIRALLVARFVRAAAGRSSPAAPSRANLATLRDLVEAGTVTPVIDRTYPLKDTPDAIRYVEAEHARAKVVITRGRLGAGLRNGEERRPAGPLAAFSRRRQAARRAPWERTRATGADRRTCGCRPGRGRCRDTRRRCGPSRWRR